ncbi:MAG: hypothetical protein ABSC11_12295 [Smithella sp.]|jgi:hypothetical protein
MPLSGTNYFPKEKKRNFYIIASIIIFVLSLIPIYLYIIYFHGHSISKTPDDWTCFAQFIGGTVGPILALANVCVLLFLYYRLFIFNRELTFTQLRHNAYIKIARELDAIYGIISDRENGTNRINMLSAEVQNFNTSMTHLFPEIDGRDESKVLENRIYDIYNLFDKACLNQSDNAEYISKLNSSILEFLKEKEAYLMMLRNLMMS